jgi:Phosphoribosylamine-glycine ligase
VKLLILGNDGRAHALVWKLFNSPLADEVICAPGNGGTSMLAPQAELDLNNALEIARWSFDNNIDIIIPGDTAPLGAGLVDEVVSFHIGVSGPAQRTSRLETSRCYAKELLLRYNLPTPPGRPFDQLDMAERYLASQPLPVIIKADHPDGGEAVFYDRYSALQGLHELFAARSLQGESNGVVIEAFMQGPRIAQSTLTDGHTALPMLPARIFNHTSEKEDIVAPGMGACTGTSVYAERLGEYIHAKLLEPLIAALAKENLPFWGFLGVDTIITAQGPRIINIRASLRDQEAQVVLPRLEDDLLPLVQAAISTRLHSVPKPSWRNEASVGVTLVAQGYPVNFAVGGAIQGLDELDEGVLAFHHETHNANGLKYNPTSSNTRGTFATLIMGKSPTSVGMSTTGGHVLTVVALGSTANSARSRALINAERISFPGRYFRSDIGQKEFQ